MFQKIKYFSGIFFSSIDHKDTAKQIHLLQSLDIFDDLVPGRIPLFGLPDGIMIFLIAIQRNPHPNMMLIQHFQCLIMIQQIAIRLHRKMKVVSCQFFLSIGHGRIQTFPST